MPSERFSPRQFMRQRRPEQFSDSVAHGPELDRLMLEYHLSSLTSRSQEVDFERFARRLAEREICPNLLPHTGPTGGGDSKVDTETYPVADRLSLIWYTGVGREPASERWAFAFSTNKRWRAKAEADIQKIAQTDRGYAKVFFVTSQYVSDRSRSQIEDKLSKEYGLDVRILDRSWILDRVFGGKHEDLAIQELGLSPSVRDRVRLQGPLDYQRGRELADIEQRIEAATQQGRLGIQQVDDCIEAASLACSLERPRAEVEGRFLRAQRMAAAHGTPYQRLRSMYEAAWAAYWWYEDYTGFIELYGKSEELVTETPSAHNLQLLTNLWNLFYPLVLLKEVDSADGEWEARTAVLVTALERLSNDSSRPSAALHAKTLLLQVQLYRCPLEERDRIFRELGELVGRCAGLVGYPLKSLLGAVAEIGNYIHDCPAYDELLEEAMKVSAAREGEVSAACMLLERGAQQLDADRPYEAIQSLGRVLGRLHKEESRDDLVYALYLCANAYERVGLLWAARGTLVAAAHLATIDLWTYSSVTVAQMACYDRLKWLEVRLGRVLHALAWHEVDCVAKATLMDKGNSLADLAQGEAEFDAYLGATLARSTIGQLEGLSVLPDVLRGLGLRNAAAALLYALGYEQEVLDAMAADPVEGETTESLFRKWRDSLAAADVTAPSFGEAPTVTLQSLILGCRITVESENSEPCVELAESLLSALEGFLATTPGRGGIAYEPNLTVRIQRSNSTAYPFGVTLDEQDGTPHIDIACAPFDPSHVSPDAQRPIKERLLEAIVCVLTGAFWFGDDFTVLDRLFRDELVFDRSVNFTSSFVAVAAVLGDEQKTTLSAWRGYAADGYPLLRSRAWYEPEGDTSPEAGVVLEGAVPAMVDDDASPHARGLAIARHADMQVVSPIRWALWAQAHWCGTAFITMSDDAAPPALAFAFRDGKAAARIFVQWRREMGAVDQDEYLRVAIVRGISSANPYAYRVVIGANPVSKEARVGDERATRMFAFNTMTPSSSQNLDSFLSKFASCGSFVLAHVVLGDDPGSAVPVFDNCIAKMELHVRDAWEIGPGDIDSTGVMTDDDPIIPADRRDNAPVFELLRRRRERDAEK